MRSPINIFEHNKRIKNRLLSKETITQELLNNTSGEFSTESIGKNIFMQRVLDTEFKKKYVELSNNTEIISGKYTENPINKYLPINNIEQKYQDMQPFYNEVINISKHLKKSQTGNELILNAREINEKINHSMNMSKANSSIADLKKTYDNFKKVNSFYVFDTETLSGVGKTGFNELDSLQEIAFRKFKKVNGKIEEIESDRIETLIGITKKQYDEYMKVFIKDFDKKGWEGNQKYAVIAERFAKLGHKDTLLREVGKGLVTTELFASDESVDLMSKENIKKGIEEAYRIGEKQRAERLSNGLMVWEDQLLKSVKLFQDNFVAGYNSTNFDFEKMNQAIAKVWTGLSEENKNAYGQYLGLKKGQVPVITTKDGYYMDLIDTARIVSEFKGKIGVHDYDNNKLEDIKKINKTLLKQESLGASFAKNAVVTSAHTAGADVTTLAYLLAGNEVDGGSLLDRFMMEIDNYEGTYSSVIDKNSVLMTTRREFFNDFSRKGALNFTHDRSKDNIRTFTGVMLDKDGTVKETGHFGSSKGINTNVAYKIGYMGEMDMSEKWIKDRMEDYQDYAQGKLWTMTLNPIIDKNVAQGNQILEDPVTYFFTSKEAMKGFVSSHFANIGNINKDGSFSELSDSVAREKVKELFSTYVIKNGEVVKSAEDFSIDNLITQGTKQLMNDPAARMIRENEYSKAVKFQKMQDYLIENGAKTIEEQKAMLSLATAQNVASGKTLQIKHDVLNILGYKDSKTKKQDLYSSTLNNTINGYEYLASQRKVIDAVTDAVKSYGDVSSAQKQYLYDNIMRSVREDVAKSISDNPDVIEKLINNSESLEIYGKDLNYFEIDMPKGYFKHNNSKSMPGEIDDVLRVNLNPEKEYSLVNDLIRKRKGNDDRLKSPKAREVYGMHELKSFMQEVNSSSEYKGIFDNILFGKPVTELRGLANIKKHERSLLKDEMYANFDDILAEADNINEDVISARNKLNELKSIRNNLINKNNEDFNGNNYRKELEDLSNRFQATIVDNNVWENYTTEQREAVKNIQREIMDRQRSLVNKYDNAEIIEQISDYESQIEDQYSVLFNALDKSRENTKNVYKEKFNAAKKAKNAEIDELYKQIDATVENLDIDANIGVDAMAEKVIMAMRDYRGKNPTAGFSKERIRQNVLNSDKLYENVGDEVITNAIEKAKDSLANFKIIDNSSKESISAYAQNIVDEMLMPTITDENGNIIKGIDNLVLFAQKTYGYNEETSQLLKYNLELHREEHVKGITKLISSTSKYGGKITHDKTTDTLGLIIGNETYNLYGMPRTLLTNGTFYHRSGQNNVESGLTLDTANAIKGNKINLSDVSIKSNLHKAYSQLEFLDYNIERAISRGEEPGKAIMRAVSNVASEVRDLSAIGNMTTKDTYSWQGVDLSEAITAIPYVLDQLKGYDDWQDKEFISIMEKNKNRIKHGNVSSEVKEAFAKNRQDVIKALIGIGPGAKNQERNATEYVINHISNYTKDGKLSEGKVMAGEYTPMALTEYDNPSRPPISSADEIIYNKKELQKRIDKTPELKNKKIELNNRLVSKRQLNNREFDGIGETVNGVSFINASISEKEFKKIINDQFEYEKHYGTEDEKWLSKLKAQMSGLNLTEQGKVIDGRVADIMLSKTETQNILTLKNFSKDIENNSKTMRKRIENAMPVIEIAESGNIVFKLGKESYVKRGEGLFAIDGYADVLDTIGVKEDAGFFGYRYTSKGSDLEVSEDVISKFLNSHKSKIIDESGNINTEKARALLDNRFDSSFYVKNAFVKGYNKGTIEYAEKGMYEALLSGAGTLDDRISKLLEATGHKEAEGKILSKEFIDYLKGSYNNLSNKEQQELGFGSWDSVVGAINKEKFAQTDFINKIKQFEDVTSFTVDNLPKHGNAGLATKQLIGNVAQYYENQGLSRDDAYKKTAQELNSRGIIKGQSVEYKDGQIVFGEIKDKLSAGIDKDAAIKLGQDLNLYEKGSQFAITDNEGNVVGFKFRATTAFNNDSSGTSRSSHDLLSTKNKLDAARKSLKYLDEHSSEYNILKEKVSNLEHSYNTLKQHNKTMTISARETDMLSLYTYNDKTMNEIKNVLGEEEYNKSFKHVLNEDGSISKKYLDRGIHQEFINEIKATAKENFESDNNKESFQSSLNAIKFNANPIGGTDAMIEDGFKIKKIEDLVIPSGTDTKFLLEHEDSSVGKNLLIDTGLSGKDKYIAISGTNYSVTKDSVNTDEVQKALSKLQYAKNRLEDGKKGINGALENGRTISDLEANVISAASEVRDSMETVTRRTLEGFSNVQLDGYSYEKASMSMYDSNSPYNMYKVSQINSKTIQDWAEQGVHYDASWHGKQYFKDLGYFDTKTLERYNMSENDMIEYLQTYGTAGIELRTPTIKEGSVSMVSQFLDINLKDGQSKGTASVVFGRNQDHDGDSVIQAELRHKASGMTMLDYEMAKKNNQDISQEAVDYFEGIKSAQTYRAATINKKLYETASETYENDVTAATKNANPFNVYESEKVNLNGKIITPFSQTETDSALRNAYLKKYGEIEDGLKELYGEEGFNILSNDRLKRAEAIDKYVNTLDESVRDEYGKAARFVEIYEKDMGAVMSKTAGKASIGYINTPLAVMRRAAAVEGFDTEQRQYIQTISDVLEQNIISRKHSTDTSISLAQNFRESINKIFDGDMEGVTSVNEMIRDNYSSEMVDRVRRYTNIDTRNMSDEDILNKVYSVINDFGEAASSNPNFKNITTAENAARTLTGKNADTLLHSLSEKGNNPLSAIAESLGYEFTSSKVTNDMSDFGSRKKIANEVVEEISHGIQNISSSGLAKAALGIAGAIMATGYIGGNPTVAPGMEASEMEEYDSLQDKDLQIQQLPQETGQGYVININASSAKGQQHAIEAIQKAMHSSVPTDINIAMNMTDKTSNINSRFIENLLAGAL